MHAYIDGVLGGTTMNNVIVLVLNGTKLIKEIAVNNIDAALNVADMYENTSFTIKFVLN